VKLQVVPTIFGAELGNKAALKLLLATDGVDPGSRDDEGRTPLSWATEHGDEETVKLLLARDCVDPDSGGRSPLFYALYKKHEATARLLRQRGARPIQLFETVHNRPSGG
jgi:ankyrin repeat protein